MKGRDISETRKLSLYEKEELDYEKWAKQRRDIIIVINGIMFYFVIMCIILNATNPSIIIGLIGVDLFMFSILISIHIHSKTNEEEYKKKISLKF